MLKKIKLMEHTFFDESKTKKKLINFISSANKLSMNKKVSEFEIKFSKIINHKYTTMVNSGSSANLTLIQSLRNLGLLKKNDNVAVSSITWSTTVMPLIQLNLNPIPVDINLKTFNCSSSNLLEVLKKHKLKAFFITNAMGFCDDINEIKKICKKRNIILIEDNCESLGSEYKNKKLGSFGLASTHSFFVGHHISSIEGGTISTSSKELSNMIKLVRAHGWTRNLDKITKKNYCKKFKIKKFYEPYTFYDLAYNVRPTDINGFLALNQIKFLKKIAKKRERNFYKMYNSYKKNNDFIAYEIKNMNVLSNFAFPIICKNKIVLNKYVKKFKKLNIEIRPFISGNIARQPFFKKYIKRKFNLPNADIIHDYCFYCPNHNDLSNKDIDRIISTMKAW
jgi:CDP-6-deoxy-D-xylo-4-hexulose-3-dehydrase